MRGFLALVAAALLSLPAAAATLTYELSGSGPLELTRVGAPDFYDPVGPEIPGFSGSLTLSEELLGQSLRSAEIEISCFGPRELGFSCSDNRDGLVGFSLQVGSAFGGGLRSLPFEVIAGSWFTFSTDAERRITSYSIDLWDGPPDYTLSDGGTFVYANGGDYRGPGRDLVLVSPIPLPAGLVLGATGLGALGLLSRRRRRSA